STPPAASSSWSPARTRRGCSAKSSRATPPPTSTPPPAFSPSMASCSGSSTPPPPACSAGALDGGARAGASGWDGRSGCARGSAGHILDHGAAATRAAATPTLEAHMADQLRAWKELGAQLRVDSIRCTTAAGSGHPTSGMSAADLMAVLLTKYLRYD